MANPQTFTDEQRREILRELSKPALDHLKALRPITSDVLIKKAERIFHHGGYVGMSNEVFIIKRESMFSRLLHAPKLYLCERRSFLFKRHAWRTTWRYIRGK